MSDKSNIGWTDATWNPTTGCTKISSGCANCYAERLSLQFHKRGIEKYRNKFSLTLHPDTLDLPLKWKIPKRIFVNSMSDLFHEAVPFHFINKVWDIMLQTPHHTYQILTKRPERMAEYRQSCGGGYYHGMKNMTPNHIWLGTSVENVYATHRINELKECLAEIQFLSFEPLIGDVGTIDLNGIDWVIVGGESGPGHRPMQKEWVENIRDQCQEKKVPFFFKQWGGITPKAGGRVLDGKLYSEYPTIRPFPDSILGDRGKG